MLLKIITNPYLITLDGLLFTHPSLTNGDVIVFEYLYYYAVVNGETEVAAVIKVQDTDI